MWRAVRRVPEFLRASDEQMRRDQDLIRRKNLGTLKSVCLVYTLLLLAYSVTAFFLFDRHPAARPVRDFRCRPARLRHLASQRPDQPASIQTGPSHVHPPVPVDYGLRHRRLGFPVSRPARHLFFAGFGRHGRGFPLFLPPAFSLPDAVHRGFHRAGGAAQSPGCAGIRYMGRHPGLYHRPVLRRCCRQAAGQRFPLPCPLDAA